MDKEKIVELFADKTLTPRNFRGVDFLNVFHKAEWSLSKFKNSTLRGPSCILVTLSACHDLIIHGRILCSSEDESSSTEWVPIISLSGVGNMTILPKWLQETPENGIPFEEYKERRKMLCCTNFAWMPKLYSDVLDEEESEELYLVSAHLNGFIYFWEIGPSESSNRPTARILQAEHLFVNDEVISAMKICKVARNVGILAIGTNDGTIKIFKIDAVPISEINQETTEQSNFSTTQGFKLNLHEGIELWPKDELRIESFIKEENEQERHISASKFLSFDLIAIKHPFQIISTNITINGEGFLELKPTQSTMIPEGQIIGNDRYSEKLLMFCHKNGTLSLAGQKQGSIHFVDGSTHSITDGIGNKLIVYSYSGFGLSPNKSLAFFSKSLNCYFDHNMEKDPGKLVVFSTLSQETSWETLKNTYLLKGCSLKRITDVLVAFRFSLRKKKDLDIDKYLDGPGHLSIAVELYPLYLWVLRAIKIPSFEEIRGDKAILNDIQAVFQRQKEVEDELLQRHFISLLQSIEEETYSNLALEEAQSLFLIQQYLNSKLNLRHLTFEPAVLPSEQPKCPICHSDYTFVSQEDSKKPVETTSTADLASQSTPRNSGFDWAKQECSQKHVFPVCILTLLPCSFPNRFCSICNVSAMQNPFFGQLPICPFCGEEMSSSDEILETESNMEDNDVHGDEDGMEGIEPSELVFVDIKNEQS